MSASPGTPARISGSASTIVRNAHLHCLELARGEVVRELLHTLNAPPPPQL